MRLAILLFLSIACLCGSAAADRDDEWKQRLLVDIPHASLRGGINTARIQLADLSVACEPDGRDVWVTTRKGALVPHRVAAREDGTLDVFFQAEGASREFYVYYGMPSPEANGKTSRKWKEKLGGLTLEVRPLLTPIWAKGIGSERGADCPNRTATKNNVLRVLGAEYAAGRKPYGKKTCDWIFGTRNPMPPAVHPYAAQIKKVMRPQDGKITPDDYYFSVYDGTFHCPETGNYRFALNADDAALLSIDFGRGLQPVAWRYMGETSLKWKDPKHPDARVHGKLNRGIYRFRLLHVDTLGVKLAELGWQPPWEPCIVRMPKRAFVRYIPVRIRGRQTKGATHDTFFDAEHRYNLKVGESPHLFPNYTFRIVRGWDVAPGEHAPGEKPTLEWEFADGAKAATPTVEHEFATVGRHQVGLKVTWPDGATTSVKRTVVVPADPVSRMSLDMQIESAAVLVGRRDASELTVSMAARGGRPHTFIVRSETRSADARSPQHNTSMAIVPVTGDVRDDKWHEGVIPLPRGVNGGNVHISITLHDKVLHETVIRAVGTDASLDGMKLDAARCLRDADGNRVRLVLTDQTLDRAPKRRLDSGKGVVRVLVLDEMLAGPPGKPRNATWIGALDKMLAKQYGPSLKFDVRRSCAPQKCSTLPIIKLLGLSQAVSQTRPDIVVLVWPQQAVVDGLPVATFSKFVRACVDNVLARTRAHMIIVTPPPLPAHPRESAIYARAAKTIGLATKVPVADLYSRFRLTDDWPRFFLSAQSRHSASLLYPNPEGQQQVAHEVFVTLIETLGDDLAALARKASIQR